MKFWKSALPVLLTVVAVLAAGCVQVPETQPSTVASSASTPPPLSAAEKYGQACERVEAAGNLILSYTIEENRQVGLETYQEKITGKTSVSNSGKENMTALIEQTLDYGGYEAAYKEVYCDGSAYVQVNDCAFGVQMSPGEFAGRQLPGVLLDAGLYQTVLESVGSGETVISFADATGLEKWLNVPDGKLISAGGRVTLNSVGEMTDAVYSAEFTRDGVAYTYTITAKVMAPKGLDLGALHPEHLEDVVWLQSLDAPRFLIRTVASVYSGKRISCHAVETISSQALPMTYTQESQYSLLETEEDLQTKAVYSVAFSDYRGQSFQRSQTDAYAEGVLTSVVDGGEPQRSETVTRQQMREFMEDAVLSGLFASKYIADAVLQDNDTFYRLDFSGNEAFITDMMKNIGAFLQTDLDAGASAFETTAAGGYLTVDKASGMPASMGLVFSRTHTIAAVDYRLDYRLDQTVDFGAEVP